ncbi:hypothetical protein MSAN_01351700 [Mycena sanguinolenta]|uniref:F-box domain-containing protein n=1 Tax=Mycena sanguinolenta TaxID=230812 RepID=A0A8H6YEL5_9AGAR|nr:hypothetical protein MSAN_01351700 [Mycena sanguinolenta]
MPFTTGMPSEMNIPGGGCGYGEQRKLEASILKPSFAHQLSEPDKARRLISNDSSKNQSKKIISLEAQIRALVELRDRERACVDSLRYIISPIRTLPIELLAEIFQFAIDDETHVKDIYRISQVCWDWRKVTHATPRLWTRPICVDLGGENFPGREQLYADGLEAWWARSAPLPVPVSLELGEGANIDSRILEEVLRNVSRFRSLSCADYFPLSLVSRLAECSLDNLEELELGLPAVYPSTSESPAPALIMAPRLRKLNMMVTSGGQLVLIPPWAQVTDLALDSDSLDTILDVMAQCTALIHASVCTSGWLTCIGVQPTRPPLVFCHLHTLALDVGGQQHIMQLLRAVSAPALKELYVNLLSMRDRMQSAASLTPFLMQSPNITRLEIQCGAQALASHALIVVLEHTPRLTHLKLAHPYGSLDDALVDALSSKDGATSLVPHLHNLVLVNIDEDEFVTDALAHMFVSRWQDAQMTSGLSTVARWSHVELQGKYSERFMDSMETLRQMGLPLELQNFE